MARSDQNGMTNNAGIAYGDLIRRQRKAKKMNQEELGALVKVGKNAEPSGCGQRTGDL